jgi:hypothetical protein
MRQLEVWNSLCLDCIDQTRWWNRMDATTLEFDHEQRGLEMLSTQLDASDSSRPDAQSSPIIPCVPPRVDRTHSWDHTGRWRVTVDCLLPAPHDRMLSWWVWSLRSVPFQLLFLLYSSQRFLPIESQLQQEPNKHQLGLMWEPSLKPSIFQNILP